MNIFLQKVSVGIIKNLYLNESHFTIQLLKYVCMYKHTQMRKYFYTHARISCF